MKHWVEKMREYKELIAFGVFFVCFYLIPMFTALSVIAKLDESGYEGLLHTDIAMWGFLFLVLYVLYKVGIHAPKTMFRWAQFVGSYVIYFVVTWMLVPHGTLYEFFAVQGLVILLGAWIGLGLYSFFSLPFAKQGFFRRKSDTRFGKMMLFGVNFVSLILAMVILDDSQIFLTEQFFGGVTEEGDMFFLSAMVTAIGHILFLVSDRRSE